MRKKARQAEKMLLIVLAAFMAAGCSASMNSDDSTDSSQQSDGDNDMREDEHADINVYSLSNETLVPAQNVLSGEEAASYTAYTDGTYLYYFDQDTGAFRYLVSDDEEVEPSQADDQVLIGKSESYMKKAASAISFSEDDWEISELSDGVYSVNLHQELYGEDVVVASFKFIGETICGVNLETEVAAFEQSGIKVIDKQEAVKSAEELLMKEYEESYRTYCSNEDLQAETSVQLNAHGGQLYWYIKVENGSYGGYIVEIDAVSGACSYIDQFK